MLAHKSAGFIFSIEIRVSAHLDFFVGHVNKLLKWTHCKTQLYKGKRWVYRGIHYFSYSGSET